MKELVSALMGFMAVALGGALLWLFGGDASPLGTLQVKPPSEVHARHHGHAHSKATSRPATRRQEALVAPIKAARVDKHAHAVVPGKKGDCETGCGSGSAVKMDVSDEALRGFLHRYAKEPMKSGSKGLESLLFYGEKTEDFLRREAPTELDAKRLAFLRRELARKHVWLQIRIVDRKGKLRVVVKPKLVHITHHFHLHADKIDRIQAPSFGGKVKRVGLHHIWVRF